MSVPSRKESSQLRSSSILISQSDFSPSAWFFSKAVYLIRDQRDDLSGSATNDVIKMSDEKEISFKFCYLLTGSVLKNSAALLSPSPLPLMADSCTW